MVISSALNPNHWLKTLLFLVSRFLQQQGFEKQSTSLKFKTYKSN